jgi:hypothetical protein
LSRNILAGRQFISAQNVHQFWKESQHPVCLVVNQYFIVLISRIGKVKGRWPVPKVGIGLPFCIFNK